MKILREESRGTRRGPAEWFTGTVWIDAVVAAEAPATAKLNRVSFEPGARTAWHTHPRGQGLHVLSGICRIQLRGGPVQQVGAGDSVWIEAGEEHWHGAAPERTMVHLALQEADESGAEVVWLEHVTDAEYNG
jgi:quercetin dioxygenase-like cupin family protein